MKLNGQFKNPERHLNNVKLWTWQKENFFGKKMRTRFGTTTTGFFRESFSMLMMIANIRSRMGTQDEEKNSEFQIATKIQFFFFIICDSNRCYYLEILDIYWMDRLDIQYSCRN